MAARTERSNPRLPHVFFDQEFDLAGRFPAAGPARPAGNALTGRQLEALWADLADADKGKGYLAHWALAADPRQALPFLRSRVRPAQLDGQLRQRVGRLIGQLDSDEFRARERATRELSGLGELAEPDLRRALAGSPSPEVRRRARQILDGLAAAGPPPERLRALRAVRALEQMRTAGSREALEALARGAPASRLTREAKAALRRLSASPPG